MARAARGTPFRRNYKDEEWREPGEGYTGEEPTKGLYPMRLVRAEPHTAESSGNESTHWVFQCTADAIGKNGDSYEGWQGHKYTNDQGAASFEQQILVALGAIRPNGSINTTLEDIVKKYGKVVVMGRVNRERYIPEDGGEGEWRAKLTTVLKNREAPGARDDEDEEDEGAYAEDEAPNTRTRSSRRATSRRAPEPEPEEEEDTEEEPYDPDELAEELESLSAVQLKKRAKEEFGLTVSQMRGKDPDEIIDLIIETLPEEDEEPEEEDEPEPPKRSRGNARAGATKTSGRTASSGRTSARSAKDTDDEPPF